MRPVNISVKLDVSITPRPWSPRRLLKWGARRLVVWGALVVAAIFFVVPVVWLLLESTTTGGLGAPLEFGSLSQLVANWQVLFSGSLGPTVTWLANSALYSG
ncbi:MAG TPA: hypothetical protein VHM72_11560, partial [Solirubrobacteraceae bacterium]|nr:hypothetical protein [Solirubrobacteraceae bacterium]